MTPHPILATLFTEIDRRKLSHRDVAAGSGLSTTTLSFWRNGLRSPRLEEVQKLATFLKMEITVL